MDGELRTSGLRLRCRLGEHVGDALDGPRPRPTVKPFSTKKSSAFPIEKRASRVTAIAVATFTRGVSWRAREVIV